MKYGALVALVMLAACNDGGDKETGAESCGPDLKFTEANNYTYVAELSLESVTVGAEEDATVDWSGMTTDFRGRPLAPTDVTRITMARFGLDHVAAIDGINSNSISQSEIDNYIEYLPAPGETSALLTAFTTSGLDGFFEPASPPTLGLNEAPEASYLMTLWKTNELGNYEIAMSMFVVPILGDASHTIPVTDTSASLAFTADLQTPETICTTAGAPIYSLDWSAVSTDALGKPYSPILGDLLRITHLPQEDIGDVEAVFLELDVAASETYFGYKSVGTDANPFGYFDIEDLGAAETVDGTPFPGFTTDGTWLVDIECASTECFSPAPLLLAVIEVQAE